MRNGTGSQWRTSRRSGVTWSYFLLLQISLAATLSTNWGPSMRHAGAPASRLFQRSTLEVTKAVTEVEGRIKAPQTLSLAVSRWMHRLRVAYHRKSAAVCYNASIRRSDQQQAPFDAAAIQLLMEGPTYKAESHQPRSEMIGRD